LKGYRLRFTVDGNPWGAPCRGAENITYSSPGWLTAHGAPAPGALAPPHVALAPAARPWAPAWDICVV